MAAPFNRVWTRQPGLVVGICPELKPFSCYLPSAGNIDCQGKGTWTTLPKSQNFSEVFGVWDSGSAGVWHTNSDAVVPAGSQATIVFVVAGINYASTASNIYTGVSSPGNGAGEFNAYCPYGGDNRTYFRWGGATEGVTSLSFADPIGNAALARHVYVLSVGPAGMAIYRDGAKLASNSATPTRSAYAVPLSLDQRTENFSLFATLSIQLPDSLNVGLSKNPWQLFAPLRRPVFAGFSAGAGVSLTPGNTSIAVAAFVPTLAQTTNSALTPGAATIAVAAFAPTLARTANVALTPGATALAITAFAPTLAQTANIALVPGVVGLTVATFAPTLAQSSASTFTPVTAALSLSAFAPTLAQTTNSSLVPSAAALTITTFAPTLTVGAGINLTPGLAALSLASFAPTIAKSANVTLTPAVAAIAVQTYAPTLAQTGAKNFTPATASLVLQIYAPSMVQGLPTATPGYIAISAGAMRIASSQGTTRIATR